jgi:hypothetical protein
VKVDRSVDLVDVGSNLLVFKNQITYETDGED